MRKWSLVILLFLAFCAKLQAQIDTEFWFAAPDLYAGHAEQPVRFCVSSFDEPATVVFEQPANPSFTTKTYHLDANSFCVYDVSNNLYMVETQPHNTVLNYGFHIYSDAAVAVYYESDNNNSEIYSLKGANALGTDFIVSTQCTFHNAYSVHSRIEVVATQDATEVTFIPSVRVKGGGQPGVPITITLNRGQCYALEAEGAQGSDHIRNTRITSNKPIAINSSDDSVDCQSTAQDLIGDQIVPISLLGTDYLALWNNTSHEYLYFYPTHDDTKIYLNGSQTPTATLNMGQEYVYHLNTSVVYINSDKPIAVFQLVSDESGELGGTVLPHINCTGSRKVVYKRNGGIEIIITLVVKSDCVDHFLLNGNASYLTASDFQVIPSNPEYSYCKKDVTQYLPYDDLMTIENSHVDGYFQLGVICKGNSSGTCSYGYFSNYHEYAYASFDMNDTYCEGENITFNIVSEGVENLTMVLPDGSTMQPPFVLSNAQISQSGVYQLQGESCTGVHTLDEITINIIECVTPEIPLPDNIDSANCVFYPSATEWSIGAPTISNAGNVIIVSTPVVGDIDNDGQQEIVIPSGYSSSASSLLVFHADGTLKSQFNIAGTYIWNTLGIAKVRWQNNIFKTIIVVFGTDKHLYAYDANGTQLWKSNQPFSSHNGESCLMPAISFADFNHDGWSEVFIGNEIFDAATGLLLCKANGNKGCADRTWSWSNTPYQTMAADLCGDSQLELAAGNTVYYVDIQSRTDFSANHVSIAKQLPSSVMVMEDGAPIPFTDGNTFLADINLDGSLDVIAMNVDGNSRIVYLYVWDVSSSTMICSKKISNARKFGTPQIGDLDHNGYPEICFITGTYSDHGTGDNDNIYALKYQPSNSNGAMDVFWSIPHEDNSGSTGLTMFDFNQDGYVELVYRDCNQMRIINGSLQNHLTGQPVSQPYDLANISCCSATGVEYPVIADVDLDGEVEIIVGGETYSTDYGHIYIFKSAGSPWAPARAVWNQYMYNVTNVNKDLTIPTYIFNNATPFTDPDGVVRRPFNNFLQQATTIDQYARPFYGVPDVVAHSASVTTNGADATLHVSYTNQGDNSLNAPYSITVFINQLNGLVMQTISSIDATLAVGETTQNDLRLPLSDLCSYENEINLVIAINCNGEGIAQNGGLQPECDLTNNTAEVTLNLQSEPTYVSDTSCGQYLWNGNIYTESGEYPQTLSNVYGCDSLVILNLTINDGFVTDIDTSACNAFIWNNTTLSQPGNYQYKYVAANGCDSIINLNLTLDYSPTCSIHGASAIFPATDLILGVYSYYIDSTEINPAHVRWSVDQANWPLTPHGASCELVCTSAGRAQLRAWTEDESCNVDVTFALNATFFDTEENMATPPSVYPNPTSGNVTVECKDMTSVRVFNSLGQIVQEYHFETQDNIILDMSPCPAGVYLLEVTSFNGKALKRMILKK